MERKRALTTAISREVTGFRKWLFILLAVVTSKRVKVANQLYNLNDGALHARGTTFVTKISGNPFFATPIPALLTITTALADFMAAINAAVNRDKQLVEAKNAKRETVLNLLAALGNYVEDVANDPASAPATPAEVIESAGMRPRPFVARGKQVWEVFRGVFSGTVKLFAAAIKRGIHEWQYTSTPLDEDSWISLPSTTKARTTISGLTPMTYVYCRHRTVTKNGTSDWEGHDPIAVI